MIHRFLWFFRWYRRSVIIKQLKKVCQMNYKIVDLEGRTIGQLIGCTVSPNGVVWHGNQLVAILHTPMENGYVTCKVEKIEK